MRLLSWIYFENCLLRISLFPLYLVVKKRNSPVYDVYVSRRLICILISLTSLRILAGDWSRLIQLYHYAVSKEQESVSPPSSIY